MIFDKVEFENPKMVEIPTNLHQYTWKYYLYQYAIVFNYIISISLHKHYLIDRKQMAIMFIYRHFVELYLKSKIEDANRPIPNTHKLSELTQEFNGSLSNKFLDSIAILKPEEEGDNFKYIYSRDGSRYYNGELLDVLTSLSLFVESDEIRDLKIFPLQIDCKDKKLRHEWMLFTVETSTLGHIKTQYDDLISTLLNAIKSGDLNTSDVYLPLLFLIRHSMELGFKDNISEVRTNLNRSQIEKAQNSHSLMSLYNIIENKVNEARRMMNVNDEPIISQIDFYLPKTKALSENLHILDTFSYSFRFPVDRSGNVIQMSLSKRMLEKSLKAYQLADPFISLSLSVLVYEGYLCI